MRFIKTLRSDPFNFLLIFLPFAFAAELLHWDPLWIFLLSAVAIIPLARYIGSATEVLAASSGPRIGGLINATLGNAAELIITIFAIREGLLELVLASITGSILGNILLVLGFSMFIGGIRNGIQTFNSRHASRNAILLLLAVVALLVPSMLSTYIGDPGDIKVEALSMGTALIMILLYLMGIFFSFRDSKTATSDMNINHLTPMQSETLHTGKIEPGSPTKPPAHPYPGWSTRNAVLILTLATAGVVFLSEALVAAVEPVVINFGISEFFLGVILIPLIGNVAEHLVAVKVAIQNQMDLSVEIAIGSSLQIALFVAPILVFISYFMGNPMLLVFNEFELLALIVGVIIAVFVAEDGESNWLEGAELLAVYLILALAFFLLPA